MAGNEEVVFMEEVHGTRKVVRKEAGLASGGSDQPVIATEEAENLSIVVQVEAISGSTRSMEERFRSVMDAKDDNTSQTPNTKFQKVPFMLRDTNSEKYFKPRVVSIGPYHHGRDELEPVEMLKLKFTKQFITNHPIHPIDVLYNKIFLEIKQLRAYYEESSTKKYDDKELAWMLFVDGCFVLNYIEYCVKGKPNDLKIKNHNVAFVCQDLFLLENQLPFRVLELLMTEGLENNRGTETIENFIQSNIEIPKVKGRKHLRRQLRRWWWGLLWRQQQQQQQSTKEKPSHLLDLLRKKLIGSTGINVKSTEGDDWHSFRNVTELTATGIHLEPSKTNCLTDVSFNSCCIYGYLQLPPIKVDDSTRTKFLNLIAYEMSSDFVKDSEVTSYICFLDSLIDHPDDVKKLRKKCILYNFLGSDEEVAKLFNEIATDLVPNSNIYKDVKTKIQKHYDHKGKSWMATFFHDHFSTPWTAFGFLGAIFVILLTVVQTIFAIRGEINSLEVMMHEVAKLFNGLLPPRQLHKYFRICYLTSNAISFLLSHFGLFVCLK